MDSRLRADKTLASANVPISRGCPGWMAILAGLTANKGFAFILPDKGKSVVFAGKSEN